MSDYTDINALIDEVREYPPVAEWDEPGEVDALIERLLVALEEVAKDAVNALAEVRASVLAEQEGEHRG